MQKNAPDSVYLEFPNLPGCEYMLEYISELGFQSNTGFGAVPISYQDIHYWSLVCRVELTYWEVMSLRKLSAAYIEQSAKSTDPLCAPPWQAEAQVTAEVRDKVGGFFKGVAGRKKDKSIKAKT